jgi:Leucine-rich repeat (LRR) protein
MDGLVSKLCFQQKQQQQQQQQHSQTSSHLSPQEKFNIAQNMLVALPSPIARLSALTDLDISHNEIRELPADFGKLKLRRLGYAGNKLKVCFKLLF